MEQKYPKAIRILHWLMALCIIGLLGAGIVMTGMENDDPLKKTLYGLHKSFGVLVLLLAVVRVVSRIMLAVPPLPEISTPLEKLMAKAMHTTLYVLMFAIPISGIVISNSYGFAVPLFGLELPKITGVDVERAKQVGEAHEWLAYILLTLVVLHVAAVLKYLFISKYNILKRMI